jgi:hypothetical protein
MQNCRVAQNTRLVEIYGLETGADKQATPWLSIGSCAFLRLNQAIVQRDTSGFAGMKQSFDGAAPDARPVASPGRAVYVTSRLRARENQRSFEFKQA